MPHSTVFLLVLSSVKYEEPALVWDYQTYIHTFSPTILLLPISYGYCAEMIEAARKEANRLRVEPKGATAGKRSWDGRRGTQAASEGTRKERASLGAVSPSMNRRRAAVRFTAAKGEAAPGDYPRWTELGKKKGVRDLTTERTDTTALIDQMI